MLPYYEGSIVPHLRAGSTVLVAAHGNSLRALVKHLSGISDAEITGLEIPTGQPIVYELDDELQRDRALLSGGALSMPDLATPPVAIVMGSQSDWATMTRPPRRWTQLGRGL